MSERRTRGRSAAVSERRAQRTRASARCLWGVGQRPARDAGLTHTGGHEVLGQQTPRPRPRRMAVWKIERPRFAWGRMQNVAIVAAVLARAMFQMWFSCGERCRSPNGGGLLLTFCRRGAKVCAAFILRKTVGHSATGAPTGDLAMRPACAGTPFLRGKIIAVHIYIEPGVRSAVRRLA